MPIQTTQLSEATETAKATKITKTTKASKKRTPKHPSPSLLKQIPEEDRPRERLLRSGGTSLSDTELMAILLRTGRPGLSALEMGREILDEVGGVGGLLAIDHSALTRQGLRDAKAATLLAAIELARRLARARIPTRNPLFEPARVVSYLMMRYGSQDQEILGALYLDAHNQLIGESDIYRGTLDRTVAEPRAIFKEGLLRSAKKVILFHNHPSGDPSPSTADLRFTRRMAQAGELLGIRLEDHLILGSERWVSLQHLGAW